MIKRSRGIRMPKSGEYPERIYDIDGANTDVNWCWILFEEDNGDEWCGNFRGEFRGVEISEKYNMVVVLTSTYYYFIDLNSHEMLDYEDGYSGWVSKTPLGDILLCFLDRLYLISGRSSQDKEEIEIPMYMDFVRVLGYEGTVLRMRYEDSEGLFGPAYDIELDCLTLEVTKV